jgi:hypothetical protein
VGVELHSTPPLFHFPMGVRNVKDTLVSVKLVGPDEDAGSVHFDDFRHFCNTLDSCLKKSEAAVTAEPERIRYRVSGLADGSAVVELQPIRPKKGPDRRREVVTFFKKAVADLRAGRRPDPRLNADALKDFKDLYSGLKRTKEVWIDGEQLTSRYVANIDDYLKPALASEGRVTGILERLNVHNKNEFILYPAIGRPVACVFPDELFEQIRLAVKRNVTVYGTVFYPPDGPHPDKVQVKELEIHPPDAELPTLGQLRGAFRGCFGDKTTPEFVRMIRDEQD